MSNGVKGALWMLVTVASFLGMAISGRELSEDMSTAAVLFWRSLVGLVIMVPIAVAGMGLAGIITRRPFQHLTRNAVHFAGQFGWFYGIAYLPLAQVTALSSSLPVMGAILAVIFLKERVGFWRATMIGVAFVGVLMVLRPGWIPIETASVVVLLGTACYAASSIMVKAMTRTEAPRVVVLYMMLMQTPMALVFALPDWQWPALVDAPFIVMVGATGLLAHFAMAKALSLADASLVLPVNYLQLPIMAVAGYALYAEAPDPWTLAGGALILAANWINIRREAKARGRQAGGVQA